MTQTQKDNLINKAHDILDRDGVVCMKFAFSDFEELMRNYYKEQSYRNILNCFNNPYYNGDILDYMGSRSGGVDFVCITIGRSGSYDNHEFLGMVLSDILFIGPDKAYTL